MNFHRFLCVRLGPLALRLHRVGIPHTEGDPIFFVLHEWQARELAAARRWRKYHYPRLFWYRRIL